MAWWFWLLLWIVLVLVLLLVMVLGAIHLWRKAKGLLGEVSDAQEALARAYVPDAEPVTAPESARSSLPSGWDAAFADPAEVRRTREGERDARVAARRERRIASLYAHGRPRRWGDLDENVEQ
jgi:hypothetical protein